MRFAAFNTVEGIPGPMPQPLANCAVLRLVVITFALMTAPAWAQVTLGLGGELFYDNGEIDREERISLQRDTTETAYTNDFYASGSLWVLLPLADSFRFGGGFTYYGSYAYIPDNADEDDDNPEVVLGPLMEITGRFEWLLPLEGDFDLILGAHAGLALLIPDEDFEAEIESLQNQNVSVAGPAVPRLGYVVGPVVATRWRVHEMLAIRSDLAFFWEQIFLFQTEDNVNGVPFLLEQRADILRFKFGLSLELTL